MRPGLVVLGGGGREVLLLMLTPVGEVPVQLIGDRVCEVVQLSRPQPRG